MRERWPSYALAGALFVLLGVFLLWPIVTVVHSGFVDRGEFTLYFLRQAVTDDIYRTGLANSAKVAVATTVLCLVIGTGLAQLAVRYDFAAKRVWTGLVLVPMILPPFVGAIGVRTLLAPLGGPVNVLLQRLGLLGEGGYIDWLGASPFWAVVVLETLHLYPILYLNAEAALANVDPAMQEAARNLGAGGWRTFRRVTLPLMRPGLFAGCTIVFIWSFTELGTPLMLQYRSITAVQIYDGLKEIELNPQPYALVVMLLVVTVAAYLVGKLLLGRQAYAMAGRATVGRSVRTVGLGGRVLPAVPFALVTGVALLPHVGVVLVAVAERWSATVLPSEWTGIYLADAFRHDLAGSSIMNSLRYASLSMALDLVLGTAVAYVVVRTAVRGRELLDALAMLPLAVPGLVMAFGYLSISQPGRLLEALNPGRDPTVLLVIAYAVRRLPYVVRSAAAGLQQTSVTFEEAAANLGAGRWMTLRRVTLPLIAANLIAGGLLAFSFAMLEVSDSLILAGERSGYPITKAIYSLSQNVGIGIPLASALGVWGMVLLGVTIIGASVLLGRRLGALFRV